MSPEQQYEIPDIPKMFSECSSVSYYIQGNILEKSNPRCCQSFLISFADLWESTNQISQLLLETLNLGVDLQLGENGH